jgi:hypothetical protein
MAKNGKPRSGRAGGVKNRSQFQAPNGNWVENLLKIKQADYHCCNRRHQFNTCRRIIHLIKENNPPHYNSLITSNIRMLITAI